MAPPASGGRSSTVASPPAIHAVHRLFWSRAAHRTSLFTAVRKDTRGEIGSAQQHLNQHQLMQHSMPIFEGQTIRTTITIDDELLAKATKLAGAMNRTALVREGLRALIERESAKRLARLGGSQPALKAAPRRRQERAA